MNNIVVVTKTQAITANTPKHWTPNRWKPPPYARPPSTANTPVRIVPIAPHAPWTPIAPTGSSIFNFWSKNSITTTTVRPATIPIIHAPIGLTTAHPAVIATRPASEPFRVIETSGFLYLTQVNIIVVTVAAAAAILVVTNTLPARIKLSSPVIEVVEHPLNPNQQNHNINTPRAPTVILCPGIAFALPSLLYFPIRGPKILAPTKAARPPTIWTAVEPAKSINPNWESQPPPQIQWPDIG